jgi:sigma-B regulation protein RsbU (phosphoserine phosphatase)
LQSRANGISGMTEHKARILVVDDVAENRDLLLRRLRRLGFTLIDQAADGIEALAAIDANPYDLVLLDIMMPQLDGFGVLGVLKQDGRINDLPVVVISALNEIDPVVRCIELGAEDFIFKPFNPTLLRARVLATLEKKMLRDRMRDELKRKQWELNEARTLQLSLVPPRFSGSLSGRALSIDVLLEPAKEVGGDLVDHFRIGEKLVVLALGDVSDKGAAAALMMARTHAMVRGLAARPDAEALFRQPERAADIVNAALAEGNASCTFVTFLLAAFDTATGRLAYVRAGHVPPFHRNGTGVVARLDVLGGPPLGLMEDTQYCPGSVDILPGDRVLVVTDGVTEAHHPDGQLFGDSRVADFLATLDPAEAEPLKRLVGSVRIFESGLPAFDDTAAILLTLGR